MAITLKPVSVPDFRRKTVVPIQVFEFTHKLAWNVLKDYLQDRDNQNIKGSKDATREAFKVELIAEIQSRNVSSHTYDER